MDVVAQLKAFNSDHNGLPLKVGAALVGAALVGGIAFAIYKSSYNVMLEAVPEGLVTDIVTTIGEVAE